VSDAQTAYEKTLTGLAPALAGASLIYGAGMLESGMTMDLGQMVMDNEAIALIRKFVAGVLVNDETLAVDLIDEVGPGGEFISTAHTLKHMREASQPRLFDRTVRAVWQEAGALDMATRAREEARRVLAEHVVEPLPADVLQQIERIVAQADRDAGAVVG
jgi:trimethylamine---corrinoid protein Co-methyltransferase